MAGRPFAEPRSAIGRIFMPRDRMIAPPMFPGYPNMIPAMPFYSGHYQMSHPSKLSSNDTTKASLRESFGITSFEEHTKPSRGHSEDTTMLQKRKRGRPKKTVVEAKITKKRSVSEEEDSLQLKEDNLIFMNENAHVFESDSETQQGDMTKVDLDGAYKLTFSNHVGLNPAADADERNKPFRLDIGKLIKTIESEHAKNKIKKFVCRFCGKAFDKPSSLGGHTAKTHNGLSLKYKNRLTAAKNRKTERNRIQFLKQSINEGMEDEDDVDSEDSCN